MNFECEFSDIENLGTEIKPDYEFSAFDCDFSNLYELIESPTTTASFTLDKTFSYADFFIIGFLTIFLLIKAVEIIWNKVVEG